MMSRQGEYREYHEMQGELRSAQDFTLVTALLMLGAFLAWAVAPDVTWMKNVAGGVALYGAAVSVYMGVKSRRLYRQILLSEMELGQRIDRAAHEMQVPPSSRQSPPPKRPYAA